MTTKQSNTNGHGKDDWAEFLAGTELPLGMVVYQGLLQGYYIFLERKYPGYDSGVTGFPKQLASDAAFGYTPSIDLAGVYHALEDVETPTQEFLEKILEKTDAM